MMELYSDHCQIVRDGLSGRATVDEQTLASVAVLGERLEHVRKLGGKFSQIEFSPAVEQLKTRSSGLAVS